VRRRITGRGVPGSLVGGMSSRPRKAPIAGSSRSLRRRIGRRFNSRPVLLTPSAFAVIADPVSSVAYRASVVVLLAMARLSHGEHRAGTLVVSLLGVVVVAFTLLVNMARGQPIASVAAAVIIALGRQRLWTRAGKPRGIASAVSAAERAL
jgi:hypothetical protein